MPPFRPFDRKLYGSSPHMRNMAKLSSPEGSPGGASTPKMTEKTKP